MRWHPGTVGVVLAVGLLASGCERSYARKEQARNSPRGVPPASTSPAVATVPVSTPVPPAPPPMPAPTAPLDPPRSTAVSGIVPPLPSTGANDLPSATPVALTTPADDDEFAADRKTAKERRDERKQRREERKDPPPPPMPPEPPGVPPAPLPPITPTPSKTPSLPTKPTGDVRALVEASRARYAGVPDFEAHLVKREVVNGKAFPQEESLYHLRQKPHSVAFRVISEAGEGREVLYVQGQFENKIHLITGKGDNRLVGTGYKTSLAVDDRQVQSKNRYKITEAGFGRTLAPLLRQVDAGIVTSLGKVNRPEYPYPLDGIEVSLRPGDDALMPRGGKRQIFFDSQPNSPGYQLPVLVITTDEIGKEVEYYCFDRIKIPSGWTDADWSPDRLGKSR